MAKISRIISTLLLISIALAVSAMIGQVACSVQQLITTTEPAPASPTPTLTRRATETPTPTPHKTPPPTWTMTYTPSPSPTATPKPPTPTITPTPLPPRRPTAVSIEITPTPHPSFTLTIPAAVPRQHIPEEAITFVLLGSDQRPDWEDWHTDAIQYVVIYPDIPSVAILSIPRDLYVYIPNFWMSRINFADMYGEIHHYEGGGLGLLNQTLLYNLGITADYYIKVNFDGLIGLVDTLGGIDIPVYCRLEDYWPYPDAQGQYHTIALEPGIHHMNGELALWYSRSRKTTSVFSRERRQQQVLEAMWRKGKQANLLDTVPALYDQTHTLFETDLDLGNMLALAKTAAQLDPVDVRVYNIGWAQVQPYTTYQGGNVFLPIWQEIAPIINNVVTPPASGRAAHNAIQVEVWNGTMQTDWDRLAADQLYHYGYIPIIGTPDRRDYAQTQIVFFGDTLKGSGLPQLQSLFNVSQNNLIQQAGIDTDIKLRLILGYNYVTCPY